MKILAIVFLILFFGLAIFAYNADHASKLQPTLSATSQAANFTFPTLIPTKANQWTPYDEDTLRSYMINSGISSTVASCVTQYAVENSSQIGLQFLRNSQLVVASLKYCNAQLTPTPQYTQRSNTVFTCLDPVVGQPAPCLQDSRNPIVCVDVANGNAFRCQDTRPL